MITFGFCRFIFTDHTDRTPKLPCERRNSYPKPNRQTKKNQDVEEEKDGQQGRKEKKRREKE